MKKLPQNLEKVLDNLHKNIWWTGEVSNKNVYLYHATTNLIGCFGYNVDKHKDNLEIYEFRLKEENSHRKVKRNMFLFP